MIKKNGKTGVFSQNLLGNILGSVGVKGFSVVVQVLVIPAYIRYFPETLMLGVWFTMVSVLNWILTFDLGIGNGLRNNLVNALIEGNTRKTRSYISSAYGIIGLISVITLIVGYIGIGCLDLNALLKIPNGDVSPKTLATVFRILFCGVIIQFFLKLITSILYALQKTALSNALTLVSSLLVFGFVSIKNNGGIEQRLIELAIFNVVAINLPLIAATILIFARALKQVRPSPLFFSLEYALDVLKLGGGFFVIQIAFMVVTSTNEVLITWLYGARYVVPYQVYFKMFYLWITLFALVTNPVWSAITKAKAQRRFQWIRNASRILNAGAVLVTLGAFTFVLIFQWIVDVWLGPDAFMVSSSISFAFAILVCVMVFVLSVTCVANGIAEIKMQMTMNVIAAFLKIPVALLLSHYIDSWICVVWANVIVLLPAAICQPIYTKKKLDYLSECLTSNSMEGI